MNFNLILFNNSCCDRTITQKVFFDPENFQEKIQKELFKQKNLQLTNFDQILSPDINVRMTVEPGVMAML